MKRSAKTPRYDYTMLTVIFLLVTIGLILLYSTSAYNGMVKFQDPYYYLKKQGFATALGLVGMFVVARVDYHTSVSYTHLDVYKRQPRKGEGDQSGKRRDRGQKWDSPCDK